MQRNALRQMAVQAGKKAGLTGLALMAFVQSALAAVPAAVTTAITDGFTDTTTVATQWVVGLMALAAFFLILRARRG
ncbi:MAG: major capsid protein [Georgfuchsia sp.]